MEQNFETEVLSRLAVIESKLDSYKEIKKVVYEADNRSKQNENDITELKQRVRAIEEKPSKRWEDLIKTILTCIATAIAGYFLAKFRFVERK